MVSLDLEISFWVCETYKQQLFHIWHHAFELFEKCCFELFVECFEYASNTKILPLFVVRKSHIYYTFLLAFFHEWSRKPWIETFNCMSMMLIVKCILLHASVSHFFTLFGVLNGRHRRSLGKVRLRSNKWRFLCEYTRLWFIDWINRRFRLSGINGTSH